jgi:hypothetical protein
VAGGAFFTRYLANNISILEKINFSDVAASLSTDNVAGLDKDARLNFVELYVNAPSFSRNFETSFPAFSMEPEGAGLRQCASVALGGLFHYLGLVLRELVAQEQIEAEDVDNLTLSFAGRGSALYRYFERGDRYDTPLHHLAGLLISAAGRDPTDAKIDIQFSVKPKHEVALGLLTETRVSAKGDKASRFTPIGEALDVDAEGKKVSLAPEADVQALMSASNPRDLQLSELQAFLADLKRQTGVDIDLARSPEGTRVIKQRVGSEIRQSFRQVTAEDWDEDAQALEPPFITALRALIDIMNLPIAERDRLLTVKEKVR